MNRLLVVDDNADFRLLVRLAIEASGDLEIVGEAWDAETTIARATELQPDVILLDILLPGIDGLSLVPELRAVAPAAAIVAVSAYPKHQLWGQFPSASMLPYLSKDLSVTDFPDELVRAAGLATRAGTPLAIESERFPADLQSARSARRFARHTLDGWGCGDLVDSVELLVSELVTNAVVHARSDVELAISLRTDRVRIEVIDSTDSHVYRRDAVDDSQSGRGMALIEALAMAWGIDTLVAGKSIWFEVGREQTVSGTLSSEA